MNISIPLINQHLLKGCIEMYIRANVKNLIIGEYMIGKKSGQILMHWLTGMITNKLDLNSIDGKMMGIMYSLILSPFILKI